MSPQVNKKAPCSFKLKPELLEGARIKAEAQGRTLTNYLEQLIAKDLKRKK